MKFESKVAIVTGSGRGIGRAIALAFAAEGALVVLAEIDEKSISDTEHAIGELGGRSFAVPTDVTRREAVDQLAEQVIDRFDAVDILVNNVGGGGGSNSIDLAQEDWVFGIDINLTGTFNCCAALAPYMIRRGRGKIVNIASGAARNMSREFASVAYVAAKGGVSALTRQLAWVLGPKGINVNAVEPGHVWTELTRDKWPSFPDEVKERIMREIPLGRMASPGEIADAVLFLASADADYVQGAAIPVNGGRWMA